MKLDKQRRKKTKEMTTESGERQERKCKDAGFEGK
jgi:hypothetical protein